jgi:hypothetical protein
VALTNLLKTLQSITNKPDGLDPKLAEYAFVPISQVLRLSRQVPVRALELCLECISTLLRAGWGGGLEPALSGQLLILFTFLAKPSSVENGIAATSEELQSLAFQCIAELLVEVSRTNRGREAVTATANVPALGEAVLLMLDSLTDSKSNSVKMQAVAALKALIGAITDDDALASFLPKMVSSLTKLLTLSSSNRPSFRVLEQGLDVVTSLILRLLSDKQTKSLPSASTTKTSTKSVQVSRTVSWLHATASQFKLALANILRLRDHNKPEVRSALLRLCVSLVQECRESLSICTTMAIETAVNLAGREESHNTIEDQVRLLLSSDQQLSDLLRESLHGWIVSLPRLMQSKDDHGRRQLICQITTTVRLFDHEPTFIHERLADSLRDGISAVLADSKSLEELPSSRQESSTNRGLLPISTHSSSFQPLKLRLKGQEDLMIDFNLLVHELAKSTSTYAVVQELIRSLNIGSQEMRTASFWLSVNLLKDASTNSTSIDDFVDLGTPSLREELLDDLYAHSVTILNQRGLEADMSWHIYALALETIALQASRYKEEFSAELSEVLYPILHHLGDSNEALRNHASTCLNILAKECGYASAGELVIENVDYIINAVGLKLATGDVSPQAPQVLLMMMRLCGPSLLPYLDDLVASIFDALERYHGYPRLTELLFSVLQGMTEEGVKAPQLLTATNHNNKEDSKNKKMTTMADVVATVKRIEFDARSREVTDETYAKGTFPQEPWKDTTATEAKTEGDSTLEEEGSADAQSPELSPPAPRTFDILLKISELTQHYLTTTSPNLRISLLSLLRTTIPALAKHENSFLPLINTLWPVLLPRLQDPEAFIVSNALDVVALMCEHAGNFMGSRIEHAWDIFKKVHLRTKVRDNSRGSNSGLLMSSLSFKSTELGMARPSLGTSPASDDYRPEIYVDAPTRMIWNSLVSLFCAVAEHVAIRDEQFDEILDMLDPVLEKDGVRRALDTRNADAVWLRLYTKSKTSAKPPRVPVGKSHWQFVQI